MDIQSLRHAVGGCEATSTAPHPAVDLDGGGAIFTIFNTLLDYPEALEAVRAELKRKRQQLPSN